MNINQNINKLLYALKIKGQFYKINTYQFYSEKNDKYCTKYQVLKKELIEEFDIEENKIVYKEKYVLKEECYSKIDFMKYLAEEHRKGSEASG